MMLVLLLLPALLAVGFVLWPFVRQTEGDIAEGDPSLEAGEDLRWRQTALYEAIRELDFDYQAGRYSQEDYERQRLYYERQAAAVLQALDQQTRDEAQQILPLSHHRIIRQGSLWRRWGLIMGVLALCGLAWGYWLGRTTSGSPDIPALLAAADAALAQGQVSDAIRQYRAVLEQDANNSMALTRLAILAQRSGQPALGLRLIDRVLKQQPRSLLAWQVKGFLHYDQGELQPAITAWETYLRLAPANDPHRKLLTSLITRAKQRLQTSSEATESSSETAPATISGTITLAGDPPPQMPKGAALFIMAVTETGPPLAVKRIVNPQFPLHYTLGANDVMLAGRPWTGTVKVSARLRTTGIVGPLQPDDLVGNYADNPVPVGTTGVDMTLKRQG